MDVTPDAVSQQMRLSDGVCWVWGCLCVTGLLRAGQGVNVRVHTGVCAPLCAVGQICVHVANGCVFLQTVGVQPYW